MDGHVCGDVEAEKVLFATRRGVWQSVQNERESELREQVRARDIALAEQRARHIRESLVCREKLHAFASSVDDAEKIAKLLGWVSAVRDNEWSPLNSPTERSPSPSCASIVDYRPAVGVDLSSGENIPRRDAESMDEYRVIGTTRDNESCNSMSPKQRVDREVSSGSLIRTSADDEEDLVVTAHQSSSTGICARCRQLQNELEAAVTDRMLAEIELVAIRRFVVKREKDQEVQHQSEILQGACTKRTDTITVGKELLGACTFQSEQSYYFPEAKLLEALLQLERMVDDEKVVDTDSSDPPGRKMQQDDSLVSRGRINTQGPDAKRASTSAQLEGVETKDFAASLAESVKSRARHFEEQSRRRLLRIDVQADLRSARKKLDALCNPLRSRMPLVDPEIRIEKRASCHKERVFRQGGMAGETGEPSPTPSDPSRKEEFCVDQEVRQASGENATEREPKSSDRQAAVVAHSRVPGVAGRTDVTPRFAVKPKSFFSRSGAPVRDQLALNESGELCVTDAHVGTASQRRAIQKVPLTKEAHKAGIKTQKPTCNEASSDPSSTSTTKRDDEKVGNSRTRSNISDTRLQPQLLTGKLRRQQQQVATGNPLPGMVTTKERENGDFDVIDMKMVERKTATADTNTEDGKGVPDRDYTESLDPCIDMETRIDSSLPVAANGVSRPLVEANSDSTCSGGADQKNIGDWEKLSAAAASRPVDDQNTDQAKEACGRSKHRTTVFRTTNPKRRDAKNRVNGDKVPRHSPATDDGLVRFPYNDSTNTPRAERTLPSAPLSPKRGAASSPRPRKGPKNRQLYEKELLADTTKAKAGCSEQTETLAAETVIPEVGTSEAATFPVFFRCGSNTPRTNGGLVRDEMAMSPPDDEDYGRDGKSEGPLDPDIDAGPECGPASALARAKRSSSKTACVDAPIMQQRVSRYSAPVEKGMNASFATICIKGEQKSDTSQGQAATIHSNDLSGEGKALVDIGKDTNNKDSVYGNSHQRVPGLPTEKDSIRSSSPRVAGLGITISDSMAPTTHGGNINSKKKAVRFPSAQEHRARAAEGRGGKLPTKPILHASMGSGLDENKDGSEVSGPTSEINASGTSPSLAAEHGYVADDSNESKSNIFVEGLGRDVGGVPKSGKHQSIIVPSSGNLPVGALLKRESQNGLHGLDNMCGRTARMDVVEQHGEDSNIDSLPTRDVGRLDFSRTGEPSGLTSANDIDQEANTGVAAGGMLIDSERQGEGEGAWYDCKPKCIRKTEAAAADNQCWHYDDTMISQDYARAISELELLRSEVIKLRVERVELEDTIAQLNVAAAQLYRVEYEQMKAKCRQLLRLAIGSAPRPTEKASRYSQESQELMHRLKQIGVNFFRRRVGGKMGAAFFPEGLARVVALVGRPKQEQGCQACLTPQCGGTGSGWRNTKEAGVQVAVGIDVEDESHMEEQNASWTSDEAKTLKRPLYHNNGNVNYQVYYLLGKLDLTFKRREDSLFAYRMEAEEGAREARALLGEAAAQHRRECGGNGGVSRIPPLRGSRERPAGAPRPALHASNLLFTAAAILHDANMRAHQQSPSTGAVTEQSRSLTSSCRTMCRRRMKSSPAEQSLITLADEVMKALEEEQNRSDAFTQRLKFVTDVGSSSNGARCFNGDGGGTPVAASIGQTESGNPPSFSRGMPPSGVPPLVWGMIIHVVGKLAQAYKTIVEARVFEREVADADLVAAITLGQSSGIGDDDGFHQSGFGCDTAPALWRRVGGPDHSSTRVSDGPEAVNPVGTLVSEQGKGNTFCEFGWGADNYTHFRSDRPASATVVGAGDAAGGGRFARSPTCFKGNGIRASTSSSCERMLNRSTPCNLVGCPPSRHYTSSQNRRSSRWQSCRVASSRNYTKDASTAGGGGQLIPGGPREQEFGVVSPRTTPGTRNRDHNQQQLGDGGKSAAVALVEAAAFSAVKRSELHARKCRPASACTEGRSIGTATQGTTGVTDCNDGCLGYCHVDKRYTPFDITPGVAGCSKTTTIGEDVRLRLHSARRPDEKVWDFRDAELRALGSLVPHEKGGNNIYSSSAEVDQAAEKIQGDATYRRGHDAKSGGGRTTSDDAGHNIANVIAIRMVSPTRPAQSASSRRGSVGKPRPHSAGAGERGMIDTRIWSSSIVQPAVSLCRTRNRVRFEGASDHSPATHVGAVPAFLERKTKELERVRAIERERIAAVEGRFAVRRCTAGVATDGRRNMKGTAESRIENQEGIQSGQEGSASAAESADAVCSAIGHLGGHSCDDDNSAISTMERAGWGQESEFRFVESGGYYVAGARKTTRTSSSPTSPTVARLVEGVTSVDDMEGLLPDAGEQAFFEAWKPKDCGDDVS